MNMTRIIKNAIRRLHQLEHGKVPPNRTETLPKETLRDLDTWIRQVIHSTDLSESERKSLQDFYIKSL